MPAVLREHQHEISDLFGNEGVVFGTEDTGYLTTSRPQVVAGDLRTSDVDRAQEDGRMWGRDYRGAKSLTFEVGVITDKRNTGLAVVDPAVLTDPHRANLDYLNRLEAFWLDERWREDPQSAAMLRSKEAGRTWRCYGRPRNYDETAGRLTQDGYTPVVMRFDLVDDKWYSDTLSETEVALKPSSEGGLYAPLRAPLVTTTVESATREVNVGGSRPTWPIIEFRGPVANPAVRVTNAATGEIVLRVGLRTTLGAGQSVIYDPRPWKRTVTRASDGAGYGGVLTAETTVMRKARLRPGKYEVNYEGIDSSGATRCLVSWRDARTRP